MSRPSRSSAATIRTSPACTNVQQIVQAWSLEHGPRNDVLVDTAGVDGEPQPLILQGVGPVIPAARYAGVPWTVQVSVTPEHGS